MCIAGYDAASGRYLLIDPAPNWDNRHSSAGGNWMTAAELTGGINSHYLNVDWWCLLSNATASGAKYTATANVAGGSGSVFFYDDVSSAKFTAGTTVFFRPVPASGYKVTSVTVNGSALAVQNGGNPSTYAFTMPSANCTINVGFSTGGAGHANATYTSAASYALPAGIVARSDSARPNSYVGLFTNSTTTYSKSTAITYYSAPAYYFIGNTTAEGFTTQLQAGKMGGNCGAYGSTGTFKIVTFNTSGTAHSVNTISISGSDAHAAAITYGRGADVDNNNNTNTSTLYTVTATVASGSGSVHFGNNVTSAQVTAGTVVNYQVTPASGWEVSKVTIYGTTQNVAAAGGVYQFTMEAANATVSVTFKQQAATTYAVTASVASGSGTVHFGNGVTSAQVTAGTVVNYQVTPASGWKASSITVGGTAVTVQNGGADHVYQFTMPASACAVVVKFVSTITATDIVFDNSTTVNWAKGSTLQATTISLGTCPAGDATMVVKTSAASNDPQFYLDFTKLGTVSASSYKYMIVTAKTSAANKAAKMYLCPGTITGPTEDCTTSWTWNNDGLWHDYVIDLSSLSTWTGNLNQIRFDYFDGDTASGATLYLRSIRFLKSAPSSPKVTTDKTSYKLGETITVSYSGLGSYNTTTAQNMKPFVGLYKKGTSPGSTASHYWALALSSSGTLAFPDQATAGASLPSTGLAAGEYTIWIAYDAYGTSSSANFNNCKFANSGTSYDITITEATYALNASVASGSGKVHFGNDLTSTIVAPGTLINYEVSPSTGYKVSKITVNGTSVTITNSGAAAVYQFEMPAQDTTVSVTFSKITYTMTITNPTGGTITVTDASGNAVTTGTAVAYKSVLTVTLTPSSGYRVKTITVNGTSKKTNSTISSAAVTYSYTVGAAAFTLSGTCGKIYKVSYSQATGGTIAVTNNADGAAISSGSYVDTGTVIKVTVTEATGYDLSTLKAGSTTLTNGGTYTVSAATTVAATYVKEKYTVTVTTPSNGTVTLKDASGNAIASGDSVEYGTVITVTATPSTGYQLSSLKAGSTSLSSGGTFTVSAATTVTATFTQKTYAITITNPTGGTITVKDASGNAIASGATVPHGSVLTVTLTPSSGYRVKTITAGGSSIKSNSTISTAAVSGTHTVTGAITYSGTVGKIYKVSYSQATGGTIAVTNNADGAAISSGSYVDTGTVIKVTVTEATGYDLSTLKAGSTTLTNGGTYTVSAATTVAATYVKEKYTVTVTTPSNGTVTLKDASGNAIASGDSVEYGTVITVTATPSTGYQLSSLKAGSTSLSSGGTFTASAATTVTATFTAIPYNVTIGVASGSGTATFADGTTATTATIGQSVSYTLTPATGYKVSKITVNGTSVSVTNSGATATYTLTMTAEDTAISVTFAKKTYAVSIGEVTNGTVTLSKTGNISYNTTITVTATPNEGYELDQILVNGTAISGTTFKVTKASTVTATFKKIQCAVSVGTVSNGTVTINPTGTVDYGTTITVTATPATGYTLNQILVNGTAITGTTFTVTEATTVTATFTILTYKVSVGTVSNGTVTLSKTGTVDYGTTITVTATPNTGYKLNQILVNGTAITGTTFTVTEAATVTATFTKLTYKVSVGTVSNGTITLSKTGTVEHGTTITVTATPNTGYKLNQILVNGTAITGTIFTVTGASEVTATFKKVQYTVSVGTVSNGTVTLNPTGTVDYGTTVTVTATAADGYELTEILVNGTAIAGTTFTVTANTVVTATFTQKVVEVETYTITIVKGGKGTGTVTVVESAKAGDAITLTATGTVNTDGYACVATLVESSDATLTTTTSKTGAYTGATFTMPAKNVTITVNFQILGDTNLSGGITNADAAIIKRYLNGSYDLTGEKLIVANVAGTSNASITNADGTALKRYVTSAISELPNGSY